jgi:hypothetical protein
MRVIRRESRWNMERAALPASPAAALHSPAPCLIQVAPSVYDPAHYQTVMDKIDELINVLRR